MTLALRSRPSAPVTTCLPAVVIPVWNDGARLGRLLAALRRLDCFGQIVVVDDGSDDPVRAAPDVTLIRHDRSRGGGVARNAGLAAVTADHVLFLDSDDLPTAELVHLLADLGDRLSRGDGFDFCLFKHADSRVAQTGRWGQPDWDEAFWATAGVAHGALSAVPDAQWPVLAQTANYPWNKVYRTGFLRDNAIGCAATAVHQDIPLHWLGFLAARTVLVSDRICVWHGVHPGGQRLTNRNGPERLEVFAALDPVAERIADAGPAWRDAFATFCLGLGDWIAHRIDPALHDRFRSLESAWRARWLPGHAMPSRPDGADGAAPRQKAAARVATGGRMAFVLVTRNMAGSFWPLAQDVAALARANDSVVLVDDGSRDDSVAQARAFAALQGWPDGVRLTQIATCSPAPGDQGIAINLALAALAADPPDRVCFFAPGTRIDRAACAAARASAETSGCDLLIMTLAEMSPAPGRTVPAPDHPLCPAGLDRLMLRWPLIADLRCDEGEAAHGDLALVWAVLRRAATVGHHPQPVGHRAPRGDPGPAVLAAAARLIRRDPAAAEFVSTQLAHLVAGLTAGGVTGLLAAAPDLAAALAPVPEERLFPPDGLAAVIRRGDMARLRRMLHAIARTPASPAPQRAARLRLYCTGRHAHRSPLAYPNLAPLWDKVATRTGNCAEADLIILSHPCDVGDLPDPVLARARHVPAVLFSEEPFWDSIFSPDPLAHVVDIPAQGGRGGLRLHQVNHHRSPVFAFDRIPYFLLTEPRFAATYARLFDRNAALTPDDWRAAFAQRPLDAAFMAERRPEPFHDLHLPAGDILGLCAWRTRLAEAMQGKVARMGASWEGGQTRFALQDWHGDKIVRLDGQARIISAIENTHQPLYLSEKLFDAFACGARPLYVASPGHGLHALGLPEGSLINLWSLDSASAAAAAGKAGKADPDTAFLADYAQAQRVLARLFSDPQIIAAERARLGHALRSELLRLAGLAPA